MPSMRYAEAIRRNGSDYQTGPCGKPCHALTLGARELYRGRGGSTIRPETVRPASKKPYVVRTRWTGYPVLAWLVSSRT
jgi:hypothetical protein